MQVHIFYVVVPGAVFAIQSFVLLLFDVVNINFHLLFNANSCRLSSASHQWLSVYLLLLLLLAGDVEINPCPVRNRSLVIVN